jgi:hypothetical protein
MNKNIDIKILIMQYGLDENKEWINILQFILCNS